MIKKKSFSVFIIFAVIFSVFLSALPTSTFAFNITSGSSRVKPGQTCSDSDGENCRVVRICTTNSGCNDTVFKSVSTNDESYNVKILESNGGGYDITVTNGSNTASTNIAEGDFGQGITVLVEDKDRNKVEERAYSSPTSSSGDTLGGSSDPDSLGSSTEKPEATCSSEAEGLGWILCPVFTSVSNTLEQIYNNIISPSLEIDASLIGTNGDNVSYKAWGVFRDIANVLFVIFLLVVIFSQLTGFGIDNYGIKKSLPKLITAAIIVNLSFIICQIAVDVSNIVGSSVYGLLSNMTGELNVPTAFSDAGVGLAAGGTAVTLLASAVATGAFFVITKGLIGTLAILGIAILGAAIALIMLFLLLAARQAIIVMLVIISPLALVCYMLPNTKNLFDKWLKIFQGMLYLFPIVGLVVGGGKLASTIIINSAGDASGWTIFFFVITAVVAEVAPFFFVPSLLRGAFRATGAIGANLNRLTQGASTSARGGARRTLESSRAFQTYQNRLVRKRRVKSAERTIDRLNEVQKRGELTKNQEEQLAAAKVEVDKAKEFEAQVGRVSSPGYLERNAQGREEKERRSQEENEMALIMQGSVTDLNTGAKEQDLYKRGSDVDQMKTDLVGLLNKGKDVTEDERVRRGALMRVMARTKGADKLLNDIVYEQDGSGNYALSDEGLAALNEHRLQNGDVAGMMAKKGAVTTAYLSDLAAGKVSRLSEDQVGTAYAATALSDDADLATQSSGELKRFVKFLDGNRIANFVQNPTYRQLVTDDDKRKAIEDHPAVQAASLSAQLQVHNAERRQIEQNALEQLGEDQKIRHGNKNTATRTIVDSSGASHTFKPGSLYKVPKDPRFFKTGTAGTWSVRGEDAIYTEGDYEWNASTAHASRINPMQDVVIGPVPPVKPTTPPSTT